MSIITRYKNPIKVPVLSGLIFLLVTFGLVACGDNTPTSATASNPTAAATTANQAGSAITANQGASTTPPATVTSNAGTASSTTAAAGSGNQNSNGSPAANGTPGANGRPNRGNFNPAVNGTVDSYDATTKIVSVKADDGTSQQFEVSQARISKTSQITVDDLKQYLTTNSTNSRLQIIGTKSADGSYAATNVIIMDQAAVAGNGNGNRGGGQNPANGTPGANRPGQGTPNGRTGGPNGNSAGGFVNLQNATLNGTQLTGTEANGQNITVNLSNSTTFARRSAGTIDDLKTGSKVSINYQAAQGTNPATAFAITIR